MWVDLMIQNNDPAYVQGLALYPVGNRQGEGRFLSIPPASPNQFPPIHGFEMLHLLKRIYFH
jgi:hypothetical protein